MPEPNESIAEQIAQDVETTLRQIRRVDGYWHDIDEHQVSSEELTIEQLIDAEMPHLMIMLGDSSLETEIMPKKVTDDLEVMIDGIIKETDRSKQRLAQERLIRDVLKKIQTDTTRNALALWTKVVSVERFGSAIGYDDFMPFRITLEVTYRYVWTVP